jgi:hypothetical protein
MKKIDNMPEEIKTEVDKLADEAGMVVSGKNEDGETEYIGTTKQWERFINSLNEDDE